MTTIDRRRLLMGTAGLAAGAALPATMATPARAAVTATPARAAETATPAGAKEPGNLADAETRRSGFHGRFQKWTWSSDRRRL